MVILFLSLAKATTLGAASEIILTQQMQDQLAEQLRRGKTFSISKDWQIIYDEHVQAGDDHRWIAAERISFPGPWNMRKPDSKVATIRTLIKSPSIENLGLQLRYVSAAARIYVNGILLSSIGNPGLSKEETIPSRKIAIFKLPEVESYEILIHLSSHHSMYGWVSGPILLGDYDRLNQTIRNEQIFESCFFGAILAIGIYHLLVFFIRREPVSAAFAFCCFAVSWRIIASNTHLVDNWLSLDWYASMRHEYLSLYLIAPTIELFFA